MFKKLVWYRFLEGDFFFIENTILQSPSFSTVMNYYQLFDIFPTIKGFLGWFLGQVLLSLIFLVVSLFLRASTVGFLLFIGGGVVGGEAERGKLVVSKKSVALVSKKYFQVSLYVSRKAWAAYRMAIRVTSKKKNN